MASVETTRVSYKHWNHCNCSGTTTKGTPYQSTREGTFSGNLYPQWFTNDGSGTFSHLSGDNLTICSHSNGYGGEYTAKSVGWSGGGGTDCSNGNAPYTHSSTPWGSAAQGNNVCVGCTSSAAAYGVLPYGQTEILNHIDHPFWAGIPNLPYGWSDCTADGNCDYEESGFGVWLFYVR
jgi:hypothetical protein